MELSAQKRTVTGRKVKKLRAAGIVPATVYGKKTASQTIEIDNKTFLSVYQKAGDTQLVDLKIDGKKLPVLIHQIQSHPISRAILHVDFLAVDLKQKVKVHVTIVAVGVSPAAKDKLGALLNPVQELEIECLPSDIPAHIEVDISALSKIDDAIKVSDLKVADNVTVLTDKNLTVFTIGQLVQKEKIEEKVAPTEVEATAEKKPEEAAAEAGKEGEKKEAGKEGKAAEKKPEVKKEKKEEKK